MFQSLQFYLQHNPLELRYATTSFSQFGEDLFINNFLRQQTGFWVDVGAYHPFNFSNTYFFYRRGWRGINIEPNPRGFALLNQFRKRDINLQLAVSDVPGSTKLVCDATYSRIAKEDDNAVGERAQACVDVQVERLDRILETWLPQDIVIDFISVDCERHDLRVLQSNDWDRFRPRLVVVEDHDGCDKTEIDLFLDAAGYEKQGQLGLSKAFVVRDKDRNH